MRNFEYQNWFNLTNLGVKTSKFFKKPRNLIKI